jgi:hypothetical protein
VAKKGKAIYMQEENFRRRQQAAADPGPKTCGAKFLRKVKINTLKG